MRLVTILWVSLLMLPACSQVATSTYIPQPMELPDGCKWETKELIVFEKSITTISFQHTNCGYDDGTTFTLSNNGTRVDKAYFDVINDSFYVFERTNEPADVFIKNLPDIIRTPGDNCEPKQISDKFWIIDDGLPLHAEINEMPCGDYGRNFFSQTVFEFREDIVLNYTIRRKKDGINPDSLIFTKQPSP